MAIDCRWPPTTPATVASAANRGSWSRTLIRNAFERTILPASGLSSPATMRRSVDLPLPLAPITAIRSRAAMPSETPSSTGFSGYAFDTDSRLSRCTRLEGTAAAAP